jgi:hypothetical protein
MTTTWTRFRKQNPGAAIAVSDDVRSERRAHLERLDTERRLREAQQRVEAAKAAIASFDRAPLEAELKRAVESLRQIEAEAAQ